MATMENILDHIASYLKKDPLEVRQVNLVTPGVSRLAFPPHENTPIKDVILPMLLEKANFAQRKAEVEEFNKVRGRILYFLNVSSSSMLLQSYIGKANSNRPVGPYEVLLLHILITHM